MYTQHTLKQMSFVSHATHIKPIKFCITRNMH